ncbi:MAG: DUF2235 domain-containing protein [Chloroflexi bacterium]|nr:DUF2235 domain-containing protein [Chloroflexota bacterium]MDA1272327.1 DUF2235 domain-containing protein [Chloroflexota bacterium]PKB58651.1 MAG: hypothetical protein BZY83_06240 [SAR202 cluster bacterium Casp-Chloro-G2]
MAKRIAIFSDGTWNTPEQAHPTNVIRLHDVTLERGSDGVAQARFYDRGVGADGNRLQRALGGVSGRGLDKNILDGYRFLVENHEADDEIYLFGFSRGAYTARSLVGLIRNCGLLTKEHAGMADAAMKLYRKRKKNSDPYSGAAQRFRDRYSKTTGIRFLGVWDTVGALGVPVRGLGHLLNWRYKFHDVDLSGTVNHAYHAVSVDERRGAFKPSLWSHTGKPDQTVEQVWFAGVHSEVGGGSSDTGLPDIAFMWMMHKAQACGLEFDQEAIAERIHPSWSGELRGGLRGFYKFLSSHTRQVGNPKFASEAVHRDAVIRMVTGDPVYNAPNLKRYLDGPEPQVAEPGPYPSVGS